VRAQILRAAQGNPTLQNDMMELCSISPYYWLNMFAWTFHVLDIDDDGRERPTKTAHVPFVTWPCQDWALGRIWECIQNGENFLGDKSRGMGFSWLVIGIGHWYWLYRKDSHILEASRVEDLVDKTGDPDTLFWKHDYINLHLPEWMLPCPKQMLAKGGKFRQHMQIINPKLNCTISGARTTGHIGRAGRRTFIFFDEGASMPALKDAWKAASDTTSCKGTVSTPEGAGTTFTVIRNEGLQTGDPVVIPLLYFNHPEKGKGRKLLLDADGSVTGLAGREYYDTPWLRLELKSRGHDLVDIGQNIFCDHTLSGQTFFNTALVSQKMTKVSDPVRCELTMDGMGFIEAAEGRWSVWADLTPGSEGLEAGCLDCVAFCDISHGVGTSNSVIAIMEQSSGRVIAEFVDPHISPPELADELVLAGRGVFKGTRSEMFAGWEVNGPGESFYREMKRNGYHRMYYRRRLGNRLNSRTRDYGWRSSRREKHILLLSLASAFQRGEVEILSHQGLLEMMEYLRYDTGEIGPGLMRDESSGARESHGDRVIAYAGCIFMKQEISKIQEEEEVSFPDNSWGSLLGHEEVWKNSG